MHRKLVDASILATQRVEKSVWLCRTSCQTTFVDFCFVFFQTVLFRPICSILLLVTFLNGMFSARLQEDTLMLKRLNNAW